jgi:uncharacterized membrane protein
LAFYNVSNTTFGSNAELLQLLLFIRNMIWGFVLAALIAVFGRVVDLYVRDKKTPWNYWIAPFSLIAFGFISSEIFGVLYEALYNWPISFNITPFYSLSFIVYTSLGVIIALVGGITHHYIKEIHPAEEDELDINNQTKKLVNKN